MRTARIFTLASAVLLLNGCGNSPPALHSIGGTVSGLVGSRLALQDNGFISAIGPAANGYHPALFTGLANGAAYDITIATQPTTPSQTCVVTNGKGTIASADVIDVSITCTTTPARFLLAQGAIGEEPCIEASAIDSTSGALTPATGPPFCGLVYDNQGYLIGYPEGPMVVDPQGRFLYMGLGQGQVSPIVVFAIDRSSAALTFANSSSLFGSPISLVFEPSGRFLYTASGHEFVQPYTVDPLTGALTEGESLNLLDLGPVAMSVDPLARFVYLAYFEVGPSFPPSPPGMVVALSLDSMSGALSQLAPPVAAGTIDVSADTPLTMVTHPSGKFLYVVNFGSNNITAFSVAANGALSPIYGSPFAAGNSPGAAAIDPYGMYLYVANSGSNDISAYAIDSSSGMLAPVNGSPFPTGSAPSSVAVEPMGHFVYVGNALGVSAYEINGATGALTPISGSPFAFAYAGLIMSY